MRIAGDWLSCEETQMVCRVMTDAGYQALVVGGCVRNALLGFPISDVDIATNARPEIVSHLAKARGLKVVPTGIDHGTVTVVAGGRGYEVTTFRRDVETFGRHATVAYSSDLADDAARRDFTMNALYATADGEVVDPLAGMTDIAARRLRFVGNPQDRITEDYLRILRFFRFFAWYADPEEGFDPDGYAACAANIAGLETLSRERIGAEMRKLLAAPDPSQAVMGMAKSGALGVVLPGADPRALPILVDLEGDLAPDWRRRLAVLGGQDVAERLRLSRAESTRLQRISDEVGSTRLAPELGYRLGVELGRDVILCRAALTEMPLSEGWEADLARGSEARFPIKPADLMPDFKGALLGARLAALETRWIASGFTLTREALLGSPDS